MQKYIVSIKKSFTYEKIITMTIMLYPILFIWQGIDFTDEGFALINFKCIFSAPKSVEYSFAYYLTNIIGGVWMYIFGGLGIVAMKMGAVFICWLTIFFAYKILSPYIERKNLLTGLLFTLIFTYRFIKIIHYNSLTALFYLIAIYFMTKSFEKEKDFYIIASGFIIGINLFVKLTNIVGFSLGICIIYYAIVEKKKLKYIIRKALEFCLGISIGIAFIYIMMKIMNHDKIFMNSVAFLFSLGGNSSDKHSFSYLLTQFKTEHIEIIKCTIYSIIVLPVIGMLFSIIKSHKEFRYIFIFAFSVGLYRFILKYNNFMGNRMIIYIVCGLMYLFCLIYVLNLKKGNALYKVVVLAAVLVVIIVPLGSDVGVFNSIFGMWLAGPILFTEIKKLDLKININNIRIFSRFDNEITNSVKAFLLIFMLIYSIISGYKYTYRDSSNRTELSYPVNNPLLKYSFTTKERSIVINDLSDALSKYVKSGEYLLAYKDIPMVNYLSNTKPFLGTSWTGLYHETKDFKAKLEEASVNTKCLPVIVIQKLDTTTFDWPRDYNDNWFKLQQNNERYIELINFIKKHDYKLQWDNKYYQIWTIEDKTID